jgi:DNA-binding XRE family transcriptional regulator
MGAGKFTRRSDEERGPFACRLRALRDALDLAQWELAEKAGLTRTAYAALETGVNQCSSYRMRKLVSRGLGLTVEDGTAYLEGRLSVEEALARRKPAEPAAAIAPLAATGTGGGQ